MRKCPSFLEGVDLAGIVRNRTPETEAAYRVRYEGKAKTLARQKGVPHVDVDEVIGDFISRAAYLKKSTFYLYKAAIFQALRDEYGAGTLTDAQARTLSRLLNAIDTKAIGSKVTSKRTSAGRRRHIRPEVQSSLVTVLSAKPHSTSQILADIIEYGPAIGIRPCEFFGAELEGTTLWICAAKVSRANERGLDKRRPIELRDAFDEADLERLANLFARLDFELKAVDGDRIRLVRRYAAALRRVRGKVPAAKQVTMYTGRSQFRANLARAGYPPTEIAALMGQASAQTNGDHYGRSNRGWRPIFGSRPVDVPAKLAARVRPGARTKAKLAREKRASPSIPDPTL